MMEEKYCAEKLFTLAEYLSKKFAKQLAEQYETDNNLAAVFHKLTIYLISINTTRIKREALIKVLEQEIGTLRQHPLALSSSSTWRGE